MSARLTRECSNRGDGRAALRGSGRRGTVKDEMTEEKGRLLTVPIKTNELVKQNKAMYLTAKVARSASIQHSTKNLVVFCGSERSNSSILEGMCEVHPYRMPEFAVTMADAPEDYDCHCFGD